MTADVIAAVVDLALILLAVGLASWAARETGRAALKLRTRRRKDREWAAYIAAKPRGPELLEWLRGGPGVWRHGCPRPAAPGLGRDGRPLTPHEEHLLREIAMDAFIDIPEPAYDPEWGDLA